VAELCELGARRLVRVGTAAALGDTPLGAIVVAGAALAADGAGRPLGAADRVDADEQLTTALAAAAPASLVSVRRHTRPGARGVVGATGRNRLRPDDRGGLRGRAPPRCVAGAVAARGPST